MSIRRSRFFTALWLGAVVLALVVPRSAIAQPGVPVPVLPPPPPPSFPRPQESSVPAMGANIDTASYDIAARWEPSTGQIRGTATIAYRNHSGDTLGELWMKQYLNAFKDENTTWMTESEGIHRGSSYDPKKPGWIKLERLRLLDTGEDLLGTATPGADDTVLRVPLPAARAIGPGETVRLDVAWTSQLPQVFARTGVAGDFVMAGQWYPKLAVYDRGAWDTDTWHANSEFFADFGTYELTLTVPAGMQTGATGVRESTVNNPDGTTTVHYVVGSVSDVAWTAWSGYRLSTRIVQAAGRPVELELLTPRRLGMDTDDRFFNAAQVALDRLGRWFGPYPWPKLTLVVPPNGADGAGGMEYPTLVTLIEPTDRLFGLTNRIYLPEIVTIHEIAHQWVPLQLATNEGREAWLDEGFADYATVRILAELYPPDRTMMDAGPVKVGYEAIQRAQYLVFGLRQPLVLPSWEYPGFLEYGGTVYSKGTMSFETLERTLGSERFLAAMHGHFDTWRWRHPTTADLQRSLEQGTGEQLGWFFDPFVYGAGIAEYAVTSVTPRGATIARRGDIALPVDVALTFADGHVEKGTWDGGRPTLEIQSSTDVLARVDVNPDRQFMLEPNLLDNSMEAAPSPTPMLTLAARLLGLVQAALLAGLLG